MKAQKELADGDNAVVTVPGSILNSPGSKNAKGAATEGGTAGAARKNVAFVASGANDVGSSPVIEIAAGGGHGVDEYWQARGDNSVDEEGQVSGRHRGEGDINGFVHLEMDIREDEAEGGDDGAEDLDEDGGQAARHRRGVLGWVRKIGGK